MIKSIATAFSLIALTSSLAMAQATKSPWTEYIMASGTGNNESSARSFAQMDFDSKAMMAESRCRNTGGYPNTMSYMPFCSETAPGFYRCDMNGNVTCNYY